MNPSLGPKLHIFFRAKFNLSTDVFGPLPATRGAAQAKRRREKESHGRQREAGVARLILNAPAMSGTAWEARLFLSDMERAGGGGRGRAMCAPPPPADLPPPLTPFSPPTPLS